MRARLWVTALGLYEVELNGRRVGDQVLAPGWTDYKKRVSCQEYDVSELLREGENVLGAILGDGWYCGYVGWRERQYYGDRPKLCARLEIVFEGGSTLNIISDTSWQTTTGPILENDLMSGETYDARRELGAWSEPGYDSSSWQAVTLAEVPEVEIVTSAAPPIRCIERIAPVKGGEILAHGLRVFDFGQNFSGRVELMVSAARGRTIRLRFAEVLNADGSIYTANLRAARVTDYYTCRGEGPERWEPRFTFHGFRYVEISGAQADDHVELSGIVLHSDMQVTGSFSCSHALLNKLQKNIVWGQRSNFLDVPTDCPQRDERLGWTGDAQVFCRTAAFNLNVQGFFHKWVQDLRDAQYESGGIPVTAPDVGVLSAAEIKATTTDGGPAWADANLICPWTIYLCYGDREILSEHYESMVRYLDFVQKERTLDWIRSHPAVDTWGGFGDWLALDGSGKVDGGTPKDLIGTALFAYDVFIMREVAQLLGHEKDALKYAGWHENIVAAFRRRFVTEAGLMASGTQTAYVLALQFGLIPAALRASAASELVRDIRRRGVHLATGFVGTPYLLDVLEGNGYLDVAYELLEQETFPSWLFPVKNGATTIWERWDGWRPEKGFQDANMNSFNHYAYGAVGAFMYRTVAGLDLDPAEPGYQHIIFRPRPGGSITEASAQLATAHGKVAIRWQLKPGGLELELQVPAGAHATLMPPLAFGGGAQDLSSGSHRLVLKHSVLPISTGS